jgi:ATP-dependent protease HslVU (ClpYQ) peptidase subunit
MAGDGQAEAINSIIASARVKVKRLPDGSLFGMAGEGHASDLVERWLIDGGKKPVVKEMSALHLMADGRLYYFSENCEPVEIEPPCAVGSGMEFAIGAMEAGATPKQAVEIAARRDPGTGGKITVLRR